MDGFYSSSLRCVSCHYPFNLFGKFVSSVKLQPRTHFAFIRKFDYLIIGVSAVELRHSLSFKHFNL